MRDPLWRSSRVGSCCSLKRRGRSLYGSTDCGIERRRGVANRDRRRSTETRLQRESTRRQKVVFSVRVHPEAGHIIATMCHWSDPNPSHSQPPIPHFYYLSKGSNRWILLVIHSFKLWSSAHVQRWGVHNASISYENDRGYPWARSPTGKSKHVCVIVHLSMCFRSCLGLLIVFG